MEACVLSLILRMRLQQICFINLNKTWIFTYFILKLFGVLNLTQTTKDNRVFMHTIGKTSEENLIYIIMTRSNANIGRSKTLFPHIQKVVFLSTVVSTLMVGKNKNIIHQITKFIYAKTMRNARKNTALISIMKMKKEVD